MANSHEPSYYEIALTNRQVIVAFVVLLVCLLTAFFSGLWIGRESTARAQEQIVRNTPPAQAQADDEGKDLEEFEFFESNDVPASASGDTETDTPEPKRPSRDTTLLEDMGGNDPEDLRAESEEFSDEPEPEERERLTPRERRERRERQAELEEEPEPEPTPRREETVRPRPLPEASPATPGAGKVVIQVFSSAERDQAEGILNRLKGGGHPAFLSPVEVGGHTMYRVRIGPYGSRDDAQKVAEQVRKGYKLDTWVTSQ